MDKKRLIIWDWDNTLANTKPAVTLALQDLAHHYQLPEITQADIANVMGSHRGDFWQKHFSQNIPEAVDYYVSCYRKHSPAVQLFDDTVQTLTYVKEKGIPQIILSNKYYEALQEEVKAKGVADYFDVIQGTNSPLGKPEKAFVSPLLERYQPEQVILIGDGVSDMLMAKNMGAIGILVRQLDTQLPYQFYCDTLSEVQLCLEGLLK